MMRGLMRRYRQFCTVASIAALIAGCAVGPNYKRPELHSAPSYKEVGDWKPSEPSDALSRGPWWEIFKDDELNALEGQINISNENVKAAAAAVDQARALVSQARAGFWPTVAANVGRTRGSESAVLGPYTSTQTLNTNTAGVTGTWSIDIWGQIRRTVEGDVASWQSSAAALAAAQLSAQGELATDYFELRAQDQLQKLLDDTVDAQKLSLKITESRYKYGVAAKADVVSAEAQLLSSQAQQVNARIQRAILEHALAVLVGKQPAEFSVDAAVMRTDVPTVPAGVPSSLLERRPDVAQAERKVAAANAQIGVATAAYFPSLTLSGSDQYTSTVWSTLFSVPNRIWSVGPTLAETVIDGGLRHAQVAQARAAYEASVDNYRQTVLSGFEQVEDQIVTLRILEQQAVIEEEAVKAAREAEVLTLNQYKAGTVPYSSVITAQTTRFTSEETALTVLSSRLQASVALIEALGGGWTQAQLPQ
jgi:NodT family efflux transporter outer membrane factor (OMF) lipoprotein